MNWNNWNIYELFDKMISNKENDKGQIIYVEGCNV